MKISVLGTGYVGLVSGTMFAYNGNNVICVDNNKEKVAQLVLAGKGQGEPPIYERDLKDKIVSSFSEGNLEFTTDLKSAVKKTEICFIGVGTPSSPQGEFNLSAVEAVSKEIGEAFRGETGKKIVVVKSTVPPGTYLKVDSWIQEGLAGEKGPEYAIVSNPETLKEGDAVKDFQSPDRVIIGTDKEWALQKMTHLYEPFARREGPGSKIDAMSNIDSELSKLFANSYLAMRVAFINEVAQACEHFKADIMNVRRGVGHDKRVGTNFFYPGPGYGGSCFPKDIRGVNEATHELGHNLKLIGSIDESNAIHKKHLPDKISGYFSDGLKGKKICIWGLAFKAETDDIRESPSSEVIKFLLSKGAVVNVHDPKALGNTRREFGDKLSYFKNMYDAAEGADALVVMTEWSLYRTIHLGKLKERMKGRGIFDFRYLYSPEELAAEGFDYLAIGRSRERR